MSFTPLRVLYVDDDAGLGRLMQRALAPKGITIEHVASASDAMVLLQEGSYSAVALDHDLGSTTGLDVLEQIRALPEPPPVIYVTGSDDVRIAVAALKSGAVDYVWKDVQGHYRDLLAESVAGAVRREELKREKARIENEIRRAKEHAEMMLKEVNHRVANSLALVSAMAQMQAHAVSDHGARLALQEMQARVSAIAGVHRRLYTSPDVRFVEMDSYVRSLVQDINAAMNTPERQHLIRVEVDAGIAIPTDQAVSIGVLITELITNAHKYAYADDEAGEIRVTFQQREGKLRLQVEDDGVGWVEGSEPKGTGLGSRIIKAMAGNLGSAIVYDPGHAGTRVIVEFAPAARDL
jgi:two-component sensor histidine kinase